MSSAAFQELILTSVKLQTKSAAFQELILTPVKLQTTSASLQESSMTSVTQLLSNLPSTLPSQHPLELLLNENEEKAPRGQLKSSSAIL
jgi:hypothetical protein